MNPLVFHREAAGEDLAVAAVPAGDRPGVVAVVADLGTQHVVDLADPGGLGGRAPA
jgi:pantothenate kinase type III